MRKFLNKYWGWVFLIVPLILQAIFFYFPMIQGAFYSFTNWTGLTYNFDSWFYFDFDHCVNCR